LYEARDQPGGRACVYRDQGFIFDAGPTVITAPECLEEVFQAAGHRLNEYVELIPVTPLYRLVWPDGPTFDYFQHEEALLEQIRRICPRDVWGYKRFTDYCRRVYQKGYVELGAKPFLRFWDMVKVAPDLLRLRADRSVYQTLARFITNDHLRQAFSFHTLLVGGNPYETSAVYTLIHHIEREWGVFFARGGTGALVRAFVQLFQHLGGELRLNSPVQEITVASSSNKKRVTHRITTPTTSHEPYDLVVSNADIYHTYAVLYRHEPAAQKMVQKLQRMTWSMSLFVIYFGTNRRYPELAHHTILFGPRYKGLLDDIFHGHRLAEDFSLYLHTPTVTDPTLAPPDCEAFYVLAPVPHLGQAAIDWPQVSRHYAEKILTFLEKYLPNLRQHIVTQRIFTPADFEHTWHARFGSAFSVAPRLLQSAYFRPHNRDASIPGLYLVGAGTHPGAGIPGVINSAKATLAVIAQDYGL
jgi:phytoene desaturase